MRSVALSALLALTSTTYAADSLPRLQLQNAPPAGAALQWEASVPPIVGAQSQYRVLVSPDLKNWTPSSEVLSVDEGASVQVPLDSLAGNQFFRWG